MKGHLAVDIAAFSSDTVASLKHRMPLVDWQTAAPELPLDQVSLINSTGHATASATMVAKVALPDAEPLLLSQELVPADVQGSPPQDFGLGLVGQSDTAAPGRDLPEPRGVRPRRHLQVRRREGQVREMQE